MNIAIEDLAEIAVKAGAAILAKKKGKSHLKADYSPVTEADIAADELISTHLFALYPDIPLISEEGEHSVKTDTFFCIDPLDGTKEFIAGNGEYCVCIAYIEKGIALKSVIYAPETDDLYCADITASYAKGKDFMGHKQSKAIASVKNTHIALTSRSHSESELKAFHEKEGVQNFLTCGSALKFAMLASGKADLYARFTALSIWDIAAGDALVRASGGTMTDHGGHPLTYHSSQLRAKGFIARA